MPSCPRHDVRWVLAIEHSALTDRHFKMNNDATLLDIFKALPGERVVFADTKPSAAMLAQALADAATTNERGRRANSVAEMSCAAGRAEGVAIAASASATMPMALAGHPPGTASWWGSSRRVVLAVLVLGLVVAGILLPLRQSSTSMRMELAQVQAQTDATMTQVVGNALAEGDYGEVQAELASFEALKYFESALVTNKRGRVIAAAGPIRGVRMGDPLTAVAARNARVIELNGSAGHHGQLLVWEWAARNGPGFGDSWMSTTAMLISFGATAVATVLLLQRRRQRLQRRGAAHR